MILRRIAEGIRRQDWFTVVLEFLIVVVGIFFGLQVDDWNRARLEKAEEREYLEQLVEDLRASIQTTTGITEWETIHAKQGSVILESLETCELPEDARSDFANGLYHIGKISPVYLVRNTFTELRSAGKLAIIDSPDIRRQINETIQQYEDGRDILEDVRGRMAPQINYVDSQVGFRIDGPIGGTADMDFANLLMDFDALCEDRRFQMAVAAITNYSWDVISQSKAMLDSLDELLVSIESELEQ